MEFTVNVTFHNLHCITPTDPSGEDEPYLWAIFVQIDGNTIRQRIGDPTRLTATVSVRSGSGRPGNLGAPSMVSTSNVHIPLAIGHVQTSLRPITLDLEGGGQKARVFIPGSVLTVALLAEEDSVPRDATEGAFNDVKQHMQNRMNDLVNGLDLTPLILAALASGDPAGTAQAALATTLAGFQATIVEECRAIAIQSAQISVMAAGDWWNPIDAVTAAVAGLDPDELIGSATLRISEQSLVAGSLHEGMSRQLRQSTTGLGGAWYIITGGASANVRLAPGDHSTKLIAPPTRRAIQQGSHTVKKGRRCLDAGTRIRYTRVGFVERHVVSVAYPFLTYRYFLDDVELVGAGAQGSSGTITLNKSVAFPELDENKFYLVGGRQENRTVTLTYQTQPDPAAPQLTQLFISNDDDDGNYDVELRIEAELPDGHTIAVGTDGVRITGQVVELADQLLERYTACIAEYLKSLHIRVKPTLPEQWKTPEIRWQRLNVAVERLEALGEVGLIQRASIEGIRTQIANKLGLQI